MQHFFFNIYNGVGFVSDTEGQSFDNLDFARAQAIASIRSILAEEIVASGLIDLRGRIEIVDGEGVPTVVPFSDAVQLRGGR